MNQNDIETIILGRLYDSYFRDSSAVNLHTICDEFGVDKTVFWKAIDYMTHQGLIEAYAMGGNYIIHSIGILRAEAEDIVTENLKIENQHIRTMR